MPKPDRATDGVEELGNGRRFDHEFVEPRLPDLPSRVLIIARSVRDQPKRMAIPLSQSARDLNAVEGGQADVEDDDVG